jgi:hypothetical protein
MRRGAGHRQIVLATLALSSRSVSARDCATRWAESEELVADAVAREIRALGAEDVLLRADALEAGLPLSESDGRMIYQGVDVTDLSGFYLRNIPAAYAPFMVKDETLVLYETWFERYMQERERASFYIAWLLELQRRGGGAHQSAHSSKRSPIQTLSAQCST